MLLRATLAAILLLIPLAGCAGGESGVEDYEASIVETRDRVDSAFADIAEAQSRREFADRMSEASVVIGRAAEDLGEEDIPEKFQDETDKLEAALRELSSDLEGTAEQLRLTPSLFNTAGLSFPGFTKANQVLEGLGEQGIEVRPLDRH